MKDRAVRRATVFKIVKERLKLVKVGDVYCKDAETEPHRLADTHPRRVCKCHYRSRRKLPYIKKGELDGEY